MRAGRRPVGAAAAGGRAPGAGLAARRMAARRAVAARALPPPSSSGRTLVVAVDGDGNGDGCADAVAWTIAALRRPGDSLHVAHVVPAELELPLLTGLGPDGGGVAFVGGHAVDAAAAAEAASSTPSLTPAAAAGAAIAARAAAACAAAGVPHSVDVVLAPPGGGREPLGDALARAATVLGASVLVVASRGRAGPLAAWLWPSVAAGAALAADVPVVVLHSASPPALARPSRVLLAVDEVDDAAVGAAAWALDTLLGSGGEGGGAPSQNKELHALHVVTRPPPLDDGPGGDLAFAPGAPEVAAWRAGEDDAGVAAALEGAAAGLEARLGPLADAAGVTLIVAAVADVSAGDAIVDAAAECAADAVVLVHRAGRSPLDVALRGSVAAHVVAAAACPVAVLHR